MGNAEAAVAPSGDQQIGSLLVFAFALACILPALASLDLMRTLWSRILVDETFSHIPLIPAVSLFLVYAERRTIFAKISRGWQLGGGLILAGAMFLVWARLNHAPFAAINQLSLLMAGLVLVWMGAFACFFGARAFRAALFPLLFLLFAVPVPEPFLSQTIYWLQKGSAEATGVLFKLLGVPALRLPNFVFVLPGVAIRVAEECSGIRSALALLITAVLAGHLYLKSKVHLLILALLVFPIAIVKNGMRIATLSCLAVYVNPSFLQGNLHRYGGIPFFLLDLLMLGLVIALLRRTERPNPSALGNPTVLPAG